KSQKSSKRTNLSLTWWFGAGFFIWLLATIALAIVGDMFLERGVVVYALFTFFTCGGFIALFFVLTRWRKVNGSQVLPAAAAFSVAGMLGEVPVMLTYPSLVPALSTSSTGFYAAFLFLGYAALLAMGIRMHGQ
ncbi:MAG: DUF5367 family protein, partial [Pseudomonadota bacterium]